VGGGRLALAILASLGTSASFRIVGHILTLFEDIGNTVDISSVVKDKLLLIQLDILDHLLDTRFAPTDSVYSLSI
jgi:hypothetical protein